MQAGSKSPEQPNRAKHTRGPWAVGKPSGTARIEIEGPCPEHIPGKSILVARADSGALSSAECNANARLIAASPDLLEACKAALECVQAIMNGDHFDGDQMASDLEAAIAKAEGGAA